MTSDDGTHSGFRNVVGKFTSHTVCNLTNYTCSTSETLNIKSIPNLIRIRALTSRQIEKAVPSLCWVKLVKNTSQLWNASSGALANTDKQVTDAVNLLTFRCLLFSYWWEDQSGKPPECQVQEVALINSCLTTREILNNKRKNVVVSFLTRNTWYLRTGVNGMKCHGTLRYVREDPSCVQPPCSAQSLRKTWHLT